MKRISFLSAVFYFFIVLFFSNTVMAAEQKKGDTKAKVSEKTAEKTEKKESTATESKKLEADYKNLKVELKGGVRRLFENMNKNIPAKEFGELPEGLSIVEGNGFRGIKITQGLLEFRAYTWLDNTGLLENYNRCLEDGDSIVAAINGSFYSERGVLGQVIQDSQIPRVRQIPGRLSRCFVCAYRGAKNAQYWYIGETSLSSMELMTPHNKEMVWFNGAADSNVRCDNLLGGGGWILRDRKDVHWEAVERQFFRFRIEDQTSRKTVVAQDSDRNLYFIVFEAGFSLHQVAREFVKNNIFKDVQEVIFLDGGSSSCIVLKGKYLVAPLYMVDKARFSCIQILKPALIW
ncbi:MAG: phosphodiester glycosidase family protein [Candidatus Riflebacteria bacterium]|nr:phosphodiester glycosidase family protein [Candidatus Riflebacteria bacterium]